jgi:hypothetical protein
VSRRGAFRQRARPCRSSRPRRPRS